ncbi:MAG: hypothetical protein WCW02_04170 [Candidatus Buchananbacteria bacterium]
MEEKILENLALQDKKLDNIYRSVEKTRKYFLWTLIITVAMVVLPLIGIALVIPAFLQSFNLTGLGL